MAACDLYAGTARMLHVLQITMSTGILKQILRQGVMNPFSNY